MNTVLLLCLPSSSASSGLKDSGIGLREPTFFRVGLRLQPPAALLTFCCKILTPLAYGPPSNTTYLSDLVGTTTTSANPGFFVRKEMYNKLRFL